MAALQRFALAALLVVALAAAGGRAQSAEELLKKCISSISNGLAELEVTEEIHDFTELVRDTLPGVAPEDYATLDTDEKVRKLNAAKPQEACNDLLDQVDELTAKALGNNKICRHLLSDDEPGVLELAQKDAVLSRVYEAKEACFAF